MLKDVESSAAALYDGGWRASDRDQLMDEYKMDEKETEDVCKELAKMEYEEYSGKYGTVDFSGKEYALTQDAYPENYRDTIRYYARAIDVDGNSYMVSWDVVDGWTDHKCGEDGKCVVEDCNGWCEDESNARDWDNPVSVEEI